MAQNPEIEQLAADLDIEELEPAPRPTIYDKVYHMVERFAATRTGQFVIERGDRLLKLVEDTAKWSLPQDNTDLKLKRPLPWIPFLMMIITLRLVRIWLSVGALMIGNGPVTAQGMVYFIQTRRRKLRAIRIHGMKAIRLREVQENDLKSDKREYGLVGKLKILFSTAICRPGLHREPVRRFVIRAGKAQLNEEMTTSTPEQHVAKRPREESGDDDCVEERNLTFDEMLTKFANEDSEEDPDFIPNNEEEEDESSTSAASTDISEAENTMKNGNEHSEHSEHSEESTHFEKSVELKDSEIHQRLMPIPMIEVKTEVMSDVDSGQEQVQTPRENRPANGDQQLDAEVAGNAKLTPHIFSNKLNAATAKKSTPGHESAADSKPPVALNSTLSLDPIDYSNLIDTFCSNYPLTISSSASSSSIDSYVTNEDFIVNENIHGPTHAESTVSNCEGSTLPSASSTEDLFYSPIGSPPDIYPSALKQSPTAQNQGKVQTTTKEARITDRAHGNSATSTSKRRSQLQQPQQLKPQTNQPQTQIAAQAQSQAQGQSHGQGQSQQIQNRYRGRHRR